MSIQSNIDAGPGLNLLSINKDQGAEHGIEADREPGSILEKQQVSGLAQLKVALTMPTGCCVRCDQRGYFCWFT